MKTVVLGLVWELELGRQAKSGLNKQPTITKVVRLGYVPLTLEDKENKCIKEAWCLIQINTNSV